MTDTVDAVVDYRAEARTGRYLLDVAARSELDGVLHVRLTVAERGEVVGVGDLRLPPDALAGAERLLGQLLRGLASLHSMPPPVRSAQPMSQRTWSAVEIERLRGEWHRGATVAAIAAAHGRSRGAIHNKLIKLGLTDPPEADAPS